VGADQRTVSRGRRDAGGERAPFLSAQCGSDAALSAEVESLLAAHREGQTACGVGGVAVGSRLGDYEVTGFIAEAGWGRSIAHASRSSAAMWRSRSCRQAFVSGSRSPRSLRA
jgi:hypothetical protein